MLGNSFADEIRSNVKVSDVLDSRYNKRIDCPCCKRIKTASVINNEFVYCYSASCGFKADVIGLNSYLLFGNIHNFKESIKDLANRFGIRSSSCIDVDKNNFYKAVNSIYIEHLQGQQLEYLLNRSIKEDVVKQLGIGYANGLSLRQEFNRSDLIKYGLLVNNKEFFINRIVFPLISNMGYITSFIGRYIGEPNDFIPRYKNLQTSINNLVLEQHIDLYNKNELLCIAEGFVDTISLYELGLQAVGILGVQGLLNYTNKLRGFKSICFCFDSDKDDDGNYKSYKQLIPQIIDLILLNPTCNYYIYLPQEAKDINDLLCNKAITKDLVNDNKQPFIQFLINLYIDDYSKHIQLIKVIEVIGDVKYKEVFYNLVGKDTYNYVVRILDFYGRK